MLFHYVCQPTMYHCWRARIKYVVSFWPSPQELIGGSRKDEFILDPVDSCHHWCSRSICALMLLGDRQDFCPLKRTASVLPKILFWGPSPTWDSPWKEKAGKQKRKVVMVVIPRHMVFLSLSLFVLMLMSVVGRISEEGVWHRQCSAANHDCSGCHLSNLPANQSLLITHMDVCIHWQHCSTSIVVGTWQLSKSQSSHNASHCRQ